MERWEYWQLWDGRRSIVGYMRVRGASVQYADPTATRWQLQPVPYADRLRIDPPASIMLLRGPR